MTRTGSTVGKVAAVIYIVWGVVHIAGGASMLAAAQSSAGEYLALIASSPAADAGAGANDAVASDVAGTATTAVFAFHAFNLIWLGALVIPVAVRGNWHNQPWGYWINLGVVGAADLGLVLFLVLPGHMPVTAAAPGPVLFLGAAVLSTLARRHSGPQGRRLAAAAGSTA